MPPGNTAYATHGTYVLSLLKLPGGGESGGEQQGSQIYLKNIFKTQQLIPAKYFMPTMNALHTAFKVI